jgi:hypothetical protein
LSFHALYHGGDLVGIIEVVNSNNSVIYQLIHLAPESLFKIPNYYSHIKLFAELSKKFEYNIIKENLTLKPTSITPAKKKFTSSPLVSKSFTPNSSTLPASPSPTPPPGPSDELDELLKLRVDINMLGDGTCTVYAIMSQLYPQTYGGYRLSPDNKTPEQAYRTITYDRNVQAVVNQIRGVAIQKLSQNRPPDYTDDVEEESFPQLLYSEYLTVNHLSVLAQHYNRVIVVINTDPTQRMTSVYSPQEGYDVNASLNKEKKDMSAYHAPLKTRFDGTHQVPILEFITYVNNGLETKFTPQTTLYEVIRAVLQLNYCIAYINRGVHSRLLRMHDKSILVDYVPALVKIPPIDIFGVTNSSISNLSNLPPAQDNNVISAPPQQSANTSSA